MPTPAPPSIKEASTFLKPNMTDPFTQAENLAANLRNNKRQEIITKKKAALKAAHYMESDDPLNLLKTKEQVTKKGPNKKDKRRNHQKKGQDQPPRSPTKPICNELP